MKPHITESGLVWIQDGTKKLGVILGRLEADRRWEKPLWQASYVFDDRTYKGRAKSPDRALEELETMLRHRGIMQKYAPMNFARSA